MTQHIQASVTNGVGILVLNRPEALNSLSLAMIRAMDENLRQWQADEVVQAVVVRGVSAKAFCAGGDIRFFHEVGTSGCPGRSALLEDFFTEEYALNHLIHHFPKPYIALLDGIVMGGGMGISQSGPMRMRIVTERTKMAMPEVNIGLFPDVGGGFFLSRCPGATGTYLGLTGDVIGAADAIYSGLADVFIPSAQLPALSDMLLRESPADHRAAVRDFAAKYQNEIDPESGSLATRRELIDRHFSHGTAWEIEASLVADSDPFAQHALATLRKRSPLMVGVTREQLRRSVGMTLADCLRMERTMVRRCLERDEVMEGIRAMVIDKDNAPNWQPPRLTEVTPTMVESFFAPAWPARAHPLRGLA